MADDLSITALYTSGVWSWAGLRGADLFASRDSRRVFAVTEWVLRMARWWVGGPSLKHSLVQRHAMIDHLVEHAGADTVVELAAGLSRRGACMSESVRYVEVDLPHVIARKEDLLERTAAGRALLGRPSLSRVGADVTELALSSYVGQRTVVVAEGLLMYLDASQQRELWSRVARAVPQGELVFDLVPACEQPPTGRVGRVLGWFMRRFTGGADFVVDSRTRADIRDELIEAGFEVVEWLEPADVEGVPHLDVQTQVLVFRCEVRSGEPAVS